MNYTPTTSEVQSWREIISGVREQKKLNTTALYHHLSQFPWSQLN
jgi:hypothetical protein